MAFFSLATGETPLLPASSNLCCSATTRRSASSCRASCCSTSTCTTSRMQSWSNRSKLHPSGPPDASTEIALRSAGPIVTRTNGVERMRCRYVVLSTHSTIRATCAHALAFRPVSLKMAFAIPKTYSLSSSTVPFIRAECSTANG